MPSIRNLICLFQSFLFGILISGSLAVRGQIATPSPQASPPAKTKSLEREFVKNILRDQKAIWTSPLHLHSRDTRWLVPLGLGTMALIETDQQTGDEIAESDKPLKASRAISYAGSTYTAGAVAASFYIVGRLAHSQRARETGILSAEGLIDSLIVGSAAKAIAQRTRPNGGRSRSDFFDGGTSFPSGHSIQAWTVATILAHEYHNRIAVQVAAYGIAGAVSVARFTGRNHYLSDVLIGSAMGYGIGCYVYHAHHQALTQATGGEEETQSYSRRWPAIIPDYNRHRREYGLMLTWSF